MYLGCRVKIPRDGGNITVKTINGTPYVYIERGRTYSKEKKYSIPKRTCIGKRDNEQPDFMFLNGHALGNGITNSRISCSLMRSF